MEAFFDNSYLTIEVITQTGKRSAITFLEVPLEERTWYHMIVTHGKSVLGGSEVKLYLNGRLRQKGSLRYPNHLGVSFASLSSHTAFGLFSFWF